MSIRWEGPWGDGISADGFDPKGRIACSVVRHSSGWHAYLRGHQVLPKVDYATADEAKAAAEAAWRLAPEPPVRRERAGRLVANVDERPPHPGTLRQPPAAK